MNDILGPGSGAAGTKNVLNSADEEISTEFAKRKFIELLKCSTDGSLLEFRSVLGEQTWQYEIILEANAIFNNLNKDNIREKSATEKFFYIIYGIYKKQKTKEIGFKPLKKLNATSNDIHALFQEHTNPVIDVKFFVASFDADCVMDNGISILTGNYYMLEINLSSEKPSFILPFKGKKATTISNLIKSKTLKERFKGLCESGGYFVRVKDRTKHRSELTTEERRKIEPPRPGTSNLPKTNLNNSISLTSSLVCEPHGIPDSQNGRYVQEKFLKLVKQNFVEGSYIEFKRQFNKDYWEYDTLRCVNALRNVIPGCALKEQKIAGGGYASFILYGVGEPPKDKSVEKRSFFPLNGFVPDVGKIHRFLRDHTDPPISTEFHILTISKDLEIEQEFIPNGKYGILEINLDKGISKIVFNENREAGRRLKSLISDGTLKREKYEKMLEKDCWFARAPGTTYHQSGLPASVKEKLTSFSPSLYPDCCTRYIDFLKSTKKNFNIAIITTIADSKFKKFNSNHFASFGYVEFDVILNLNEANSAAVNDYLKSFVEKTKSRRGSFRRISSYQMTDLDSLDLELMCDRLLTLFVDILEVTEDKAENEISEHQKEIFVRKNFEKFLESLLGKVSLKSWTITIIGTSIVNENIIVLVNIILKILLDDIAVQKPKKIPNIMFGFIYTFEEECNHFAKIKEQVENLLLKIDVHSKILLVPADLNAISTAIDQVYFPEKPKNYVVPSNLGPKAILEQDYKDYLSSFEIYYKVIGKNDFNSLDDDEKVKRIAIIKREYCAGGDVSAELFYLHKKKYQNQRLYVIRNIMEKMTDKIRSALNAIDVTDFEKIEISGQRQCLYHLPSTGGSTTSRHILYQLRKNYPCIIINRSITQSTYEKIEALLSSCKKTGLILCDRPDISYEAASSIVTAMRRSEIRCVVLYVGRHNDWGERCQFGEKMLPQLTRSENIAFKELHEEYNRNNDMEIDQLLKREKTAPFLWGMLTFQGEYGQTRMKQIVNYLFGNATTDLQKFFVTMTLIIEYSQNYMDIELAADILNIRIERSDKKAFINAFNAFEEHLKNCVHLVQFSEDSGENWRVRPPTTAVGDEILLMYFKGDKRKKIHYFVNELEKLAKKRNGENCRILAQIVHSLCNRSDKEDKKNKSDFYYSRFFQDVNEAFEGDIETIIKLCKRIKTHFPHKHILVDCASSLLHHHRDGNKALEVLHSEFKTTDTKNFTLAKSEDAVALTKGANLIFYTIHNEDKEKENALTSMMLELGHGAIEMLKAAKEIGEETHDIRPHPYMIELKIREFFLRIYFERFCDNQSDFERKLFDNNNKETLLSVESLETFFSVKNELTDYDSHGLLNLMHVMKPYHFLTMDRWTNSLLEKIPDTNAALLSKIGDSRSPSGKAFLIVELLIKKQNPPLKNPINIFGLWKNVFLINQLSDTDLETIIDTINGSDLKLTKSYMHLIVANIYLAQRKMSNHEEDCQRQQMQLKQTERTIEMAQDWIRNYADDFVAEFFKGCLQFAGALSEKTISQRFDNYLRDCKRTLQECKRKSKLEFKAPGYHKIRFYIIHQQSGLAKLKPVNFIDYKKTLKEMVDMERFKGTILGKRTVACDSLKETEVHVTKDIPSNLINSHATRCNFGLALAYSGYCAFDVRED